MAKILVTILFDIENNKQLKDREHDRFIIESEEHNFKDIFYRVIEDKRYCIDDFKKINQGYKAIMEIETEVISDIEVFTEDYLYKNIEDDWDLEM